MKKKQEQVSETDRIAVRMLVKSRMDFQEMRKAMDNRLGVKAGGELQNNPKREFLAADAENFKEISDAARKQEKAIEKMLCKTLKRFPIYTEWLSKVKGVGSISAGWIVGEFNIEEASTVSKLWQFSGLNPGKVLGKKRIENKDGTFSLVPTNVAVRGDKLTPGFVAPFNKRLRTALLGVMAPGFVKAQNDYCMKYYYPYKLRLEQEENPIATDDPEKAKAWKDVSKGRRDAAAKRYMVKMFLKDLYVTWRTIEGLPVRPPYQEEYLGHKHRAA